MRHTGFLRVGTAGSYTLSLNSDEGSKLWLDGELVINNDGRHPMRERSATRTLTAGDHSLRVEYFENTGHAGLILSWAGPGISKQVIPASALFQAAPAAQPRSGSVPRDAASVLLALADPQGEGWIDLADEQQSAEDRQDIGSETQLMANALGSLASGGDGVSLGEAELFALADAFRRSRHDLLGDELTDGLELLEVL